MGIPIGVHDVAYWQLDEANASDAAVDLVGGYTLTSAAAAAPTSDPAVLATGRRKKARTFGGTAALARASATGDAAKLTGDLTVSAWLKPTTAYPWGAVGYIFAFGGSLAVEADNYLTLVYLSTAGVVGTYWEGAAHANTSKSDVGALSVGLWTHITVVRKQYPAGTWTVYFYRNGVLTTTSSTTVLSPSGGTSTNCKWSLGRRGASNSNPFLGSIDEARVWKRALSSDEVSAEYNASCYLRLGGVNLDRYVGLKDFSRLDSEPFPSDARRRAFDGGMRDDVQTRKMRWKGRTVPLASSDVSAIRGLVEGLGDVVTGSEYWTAQCAQGSVLTSFPLILAGKYGNCFKASIGAGTDGVVFDMTWLIVSAWSVWYWWSDDGATWHHRIQTSAGSKWQDGATSVADFSDVVVAAGILTVQSSATDPVWVDDVVLVPYVIPSDWVEDIYNEHSVRSWTAFPSLRASGDSVPEGARTVRGSDLGSASALHIRSGTAQVGGARLDFSLEEA